jgi:hypothetical protein
LFFSRRSPFVVSLWKAASYAISTRLSFLTIRALRLTSLDKSRRGSSLGQALALRRARGSLADLYNLVLICLILSFTTARAASPVCRMRSPSIYSETIPIVPSHVSTN